MAWSHESRRRRNQNTLCIEIFSSSRRKKGQLADERRETERERQREREERKREEGKRVREER